MLILNFEQKTENKLSLKSENSNFNLLCLPTDNFPSFAEEFEANEVQLNRDKFLKLLNKTRISISNDDTRHYLKWVFYSYNRGSWKKFSHWRRYRQSQTFL